MNKILSCILLITVYISAVCAEGQECKYMSKKPADRCPENTRCAKYIHLKTGDEITRCVFEALCNS